MIKPQIVNKLKSINELQLLTFISTENQWVNDKETRQWLTDYLDIADITVKKNLKSLLDKGFINKLSKGIYAINKEVIQ